MKRLVILGVVLLLFATVQHGDTAGFNPGAYPGSYLTSALAQSGVITTSLTNYAACEFYNNTSSTAYFSIYNSSTVGAQNIFTNGRGACAAAASNFCSVSSAGPSGPGMNSAIVAGNGLSWFGSSTFPTQTGFGANGWVFCTINQE